jgi:hypothetical protein
VQLPPVARARSWRRCERKSGKPRAVVATTSSVPPEAPDAMHVGADDSMDSASASDIDESMHVALVPVKRLPSIAARSARTRLCARRCCCRRCSWTNCVAKYDDDDDGVDND